MLAGMGYCGPDVAARMWRPRGYQLIRPKMGVFTVVVSGEHRKFRVRAIMLSMDPADKPPIINCHSHVFTGDHVPPWLAKTFLPWPVYRLLPVSGIVRLFRWWFKENGPNDFFFSDAWKRIVKGLYKTRMFLVRNVVFAFLSPLVGVYVTINVFFFLYNVITGIFKAPAEHAKEVGGIEGFLVKEGIIFQHPNVLLMLLFIILLLLFYQWGRDLIIFIFNQFWKFLALLPKKSMIELLKRYILIGRFSRYKSQSGIFGKLSAQYPEGTRFVLLPMDMAFMDAGKPPMEIASQMQDLANLKKSHGATCFPFVFAHPERMGDKTYFDYTVGADGEVSLVKGCLLQQLLEDCEFSGIKIYPALGYYPFDEALLPLWKYAVQRNLPVIAHCIQGVIFYRGSKKKEWDSHPIFDIFLGQRDNAGFTLNFTHPLNYLCLLDEGLLRKKVAVSGAQVRRIFGYTDEGTAMVRNLSTLKICFAHFGGDDQWRKFLDRDRDLYSSMLVTYPKTGVDFLHRQGVFPPVLAPGKPAQIWNECDWYTIICSLMLQYTNTYADVSYILHNPEIMPLLKQTLRNDDLRSRVLFGTDFYVVRNYKSDKEMLADLMGELDEGDFDMIARYNPRVFLNLGD